MGLWGDEFSLPKQKEKVKKIANKISKPKELKATSASRQLTSKKMSNHEKISIISESVNKVLGKQRQNVLIITNTFDYNSYLDKAIKTGYIALDTETNNSLDPITCKLMGLCIYVKDEKQVYIPVNHVDINNGKRIETQLNEEQIAEGLKRLVDNKVKIITHNGKFDYEVLRCTCAIRIPVYWDTMLGSKVIDETERSAGLKQQYIDKIDKSQEKYDIENLFENIQYDVVPIDLFALYAATDAMMTYKLFEYQKEILETKDMEGPYRVFKDIEMPLLPVLGEMEMRGIELDDYYSPKLSAKFHKISDEIDIQIKAELDKIEPVIKAFKTSKEGTAPQKGGKKSKAEQLEDPISVSSPTQLAILLYDILKVPPQDKKKPRGTGEDILEKIGLPICKIILKKRAIMKLLSTYVDKLPELVNPVSNRIHPKFNSYGAATGRLSSNDPNAQNIPSQSREIRMMFRARTDRFNWEELKDNKIIIHNDDILKIDNETVVVGTITKRYGDIETEEGIKKCSIEKISEDNDNITFEIKTLDGSNITKIRVYISYMLVGGDYQGQEVRLAAYYSQDQKMIEAYEQGKDLYAVIGQSVYNNKYEDNLEHFADGSKNKAGKERRSSCKVILLGLLYGRGAASIAEQIHKSVEEGQKIIDKFYKGFPDVKHWIDKTIANAHKRGYVEDWYGRRRHLPDIMLDKYTITDRMSASSLSNFNPFLICGDRKSDTSKTNKYKEMLKKVRSRKQYETIKQEAYNDGVDIRDNGAFISEAERQSVNSRVQGGAATLTKMAMINIQKNDDLYNLGFRMLLTVHDEIIGECPTKNAEKAAEKLKEVMINTAKNYMNVPMDVDTECEPCWYLNEYKALIESEYNELIDNGMRDIDAFEEVCKKRSESTRENVYEIVGKYMKTIPENLE